MLDAIWWSVVAVLGLVAGSFVNVVAYRIPQQRSVVEPGSACPSCEHPIRWQDNVPILGWLRLRGRCRHCAAPISIRYPVVEIATAGLFVVALAVIGFMWVLPAYLWFAGVTIALTLTDLDHKLIPNRILFPGFVVGTVLLGLGAVVDGDVSSFGRALLGAAGYFSGLLAVALVARGGFGYGDVKLAALLGLFTAYLGWGHLLVAAFLPFAIGGVVSILLLITRIKGRKDAIPFGPYLVVGAYVAVAAGQEIVDAYLG